MEVGDANVVTMQVRSATVVSMGVRAAIVVTMVVRDASVGYRWAGRCTMYAVHVRQISALCFLGLCCLTLSDKEYEETCWRFAFVI